MKKMNVIQCVNGHFYDGEKYDSCPHCGATAKKEELESNIPVYKSEKNGLFGRRKKTNRNPKPNKTYGIFDDDKDSMPISEKSILKNPVSEKPNKDLQIKPKSTVDEKVGTPVAEEQQRKVHFELDQAAVDDTKNKQTTGNTINEDLIRCNDNNDGKTFGFFHIDKNDSSNESNNVTEPVVGWIVCVNGKHFGESFMIFAGRNSIGRGNNNLIVISKDQQISREKHAFITYEPKKRRFYIASGDSSGLTYLNDEMVESSVQLNYLDKIELGKSQFVFVPLCGENFSWDSI